jgi:hypothetical protein
MKRYFLIVLLLLAAFTNLASAFYDPAVGRWVSRDPIGERGGDNLYGFVRNGSLNKIDRLGLENWVFLKSDYGDTLKGQAKDTSEIWSIINRNGVLSHSPDQGVEIFNGIELLIAASTKQGGLVAKTVDEKPNSKGCYCVVLNVEHIVESLIIYNGSLSQMTGDNYLNVASHEANHIQAGFRRLFKIVEDYNKKDKPCFSEEYKAQKAGIDAKIELQKLVNDAFKAEETHDTLGGFGTPQKGEPGTWVGHIPW